jgi:hypothetical protein
VTPVGLLLREALDRRFPTDDEIGTEGEDGTDAEDLILSTWWAAMGTCIGVALLGVRGLGLFIVVMKGLS